MYSFPCKKIKKLELKFENGVVNFNDKKKITNMFFHEDWPYNRHILHSIPNGSVKLFKLLHQTTYEKLPMTDKLWAPYFEELNWL